MTAPHSDLNADLGCRRDVSIYAYPLVSARIVGLIDIRALCWCPGVIVFPQFCVHVFDKQPQRIVPIWDVLECDFCMLVRMSGTDIGEVKRRTV